jgi:polyferredoxin
MLRRINKLLEDRYFPLIFRVIALASFLALVIIGFSASGMSLTFLRQLSITNLTTSFVWRFWWPTIILSAIFFGRVWCMVCPVEMITTFFARIGLKLKRPSWILSGWIITLFYAIIVVAGITIFEIDRVPKYTASYLLIIIGISVVSGLIFEKNTFCRYICPVGYQLGIFSKMASWGWRVKNKPVCKTCPDKSCIKSSYRYNLNYKSCGVDLEPVLIDNNNNCILCAGCMKTCKAYRTYNNHLRPNPAIVKTGFANDLMKIEPLIIAEWVFLYFLSAHLIDEITEFKIISDLCSSVVHGSIINYSGLTPGLYKNIIASGYLFFFLPVLLWLIPYLLILSARINISLGDYLKNFSLIFLPVFAGLFIGLITMEIVTRLPYYKYILHDVRGIDTIRGIITRQIVITPLPEWVEWSLLLTLVTASIIGILVSFKVIKRLIIRFNIQTNKQFFLETLPFIFIILFIVVVILYKCF